MSIYKTIKNGGLQVVELSSAKIKIAGSGDIPAASWTRYDALNQAKWAEAGLIKLEYKTSEKTGKLSVKRLAENAEFYRKQHKAWLDEGRRINAEIRQVEKDNPNLSKQTLKLVKDSETGEVKRYVKRAGHRNVDQPCHMRIRGAAKVRAKAAKDNELAKLKAENAALKAASAMIKPATAVDPMAAKLEGIDIASMVKDAVNTQLAALVTV